MVDFGLILYLDLSKVLAHLMLSLKLTCLFLMIVEYTTTCLLIVDKYLLDLKYCCKSI